MTTLNDAVPEVTAGELSIEAGRNLFEQACQNRLGISAERFLDCYDADDLPADWSIRAIQSIEFLIPYVR